MTTYHIRDATQRAGPAWVRGVALVLLVGYLLFAHGCHGDEDNELRDTLPAVQSVK
jgi:hypothetical protein